MRWSHALKQGPVLAALGRTAALALKQRLAPPPPGAAMATPGPVFEAVVPPRAPDLVADHLRWAGADRAAYRGVVPPHLFPQWGFPLLARTLEGAPYPLARTLNAGCRVEPRAPLPADAPLHVRAQLVGVDDDGRRARLHQRLVTGTAEVPEALVVDLFVVVPLAKPEPSAPARERARVPDDAREIGRLRLGPRAGLEFACLTGDFNPVHWVPPYARAAGFGGPILHGFATLARAWERLHRVVLAGDVQRVAWVDVRFTRPLRLPANVGVYHRPGELFVGAAPAAPANLVGTYGLRD